jgi:hypothetical protein
MATRSQKSIRQIASEQATLGRADVVLEFITLMGKVAVSLEVRFRHILAVTAVSHDELVDFGVECLIEQNQLAIVLHIAELRARFGIVWHHQCTSSWIAFHCDIPNTARAQAMLYSTLSTT